LLCLGFKALSVDVSMSTILVQSSSAYFLLGWQVAEMSCGDRWISKSHHERSKAQTHMVNLATHHDDWRRESACMWVVGAWEADTQAKLCDFAMTEPGDEARAADLKLANLPNHDEEL
jgi:hypothetical protein